MSNTLRKRPARHDAGCRRRRKPRRALRLLLALPVAAGALSGAASRAASGADVAYRIEVLARGLHRPTAMARLPDRRLLVTERHGRLLLIPPGSVDTPRVLAGTPPPLRSGAGGYFDIAVDPDFSGNRLLYLSYAAGTRERSTTAVFRAELRDGELQNGRTVLRVEPAHRAPHNYGGRLQFLPDQSLLLTTGDGLERREEAQSLRSELGKVLRVNRDGKAARHNPYTHADGLRIYTFGHRDPRGITYDAQQRQVFIHERGPRGGDELNLLSRRGNYGWPALTHGIDLSGARISPFKRMRGMADPLWVWEPAIRPSGLAWYHGDGFPGWRGSLLVSGLDARGLHRLRVHRGRVVDEEWVFPDLPYRLRDVRVFADGVIHLLTDGEQAQLLQVLPRRR